MSSSLRHARRVHRGPATRSETAPLGGYVDLSTAAALPESLPADGLSFGDDADDLDPAPQRRRRRHPMLPALLVGVDITAIALATGLALLLRSHLPFFPPVLDVTNFAWTIGVAISVLWLVMVTLVGGHSRRGVGTGTIEFQKILSASGITAGIVGIVCYLVKFSLSRAYFSALFVLGVIFLLAGRFMVRRWMQRMRRSGRLTQRTLVAGTPSTIEDVTRVLERESWLGYEIVGCLTPDESYRADDLNAPVVGHTKEVSQIVEAVDATDADVVVFAAGAMPNAMHFRRTAWALESHNAQMVVAPALTDISSQRINVRPVGGLPLVYVEPPQNERSAHLFKRTFDLVGGALLIVLLSPVFLIAALSVWLNDRGPVFFKQTRVGRDGEHFECLKFRSMVVNADEVLDQIAHLNEHDGVLFKMQDDPRITRPGKLLRRLSLDELPQLLNVVRGDMSLVGPRPPLPSEVERYHRDVHRRLRVRPGMTGLWQVSGRSELSWSETVRLDLYYADNWSLLQDLNILVRTVRAVLGGRGAF
jgi:exopolysaccharide biosynthesis polyprenyl glycosylphosphotransferase